MSGDRFGDRDRQSTIGRPECQAPREVDVARIYLVRHGRTSLNAAGVLRGHLDPPLDTIGRSEAIRLGMALREVDLSLVAASPLRRAVETAGEVAERLGLSVQIDPRLIDRDYGMWAGQPQQGLLDRWGSIDRIPGIEATSDVCMRAWEALSDIADQVSGGSAVAVSHEAVNRAVLLLLDPNLEAGCPQATGSYNVLERRGAAWSVLSVNNVPSRAASGQGGSVRGEWLSGGSGG